MDAVVQVAVRQAVVLVGVSALLEGDYVAVIGQMLLF